MSKMTKCPECGWENCTINRRCTMCRHKLVPGTARSSEGSVTCSDLVAELEAVQTQLEDAWTALCKQDWSLATQNVFDVRASVTKLVESVRGHSATDKLTRCGEETE